MIVFWTGDFIWRENFLGVRCRRPKIFSASGAGAHSAAVQVDESDHDLDLPLAILT
jgi:hypothetical protein